jgi:hypothetical protein
VPAGLELGVEQLPVNADFVASSAGWNQRDAFNLRFKTFQQFVYQAHGPIVIASDSAVDDLDLHQGGISSFGYLKIILHCWLQRYDRIRSTLIRTGKSGRRAVSMLETRLLSSEMMFPGTRWRP